MQCPHCQVHFHDNVHPAHVDNSLARWTFRVHFCSNCEKPTVDLTAARWHTTPQHKRILDDEKSLGRIYPRGSGRVPAPQEVRDADPSVAADYREACDVLEVSPKASAALSRRLLQRILVEKAKAKEGDLVKQIQEAADAGDFPQELASDLHAMRKVGNFFAVHPTKSVATGEIMEVAPGEADWMLDLLEHLLDRYYVQPAKRKAMRDGLNQRLKEAGKDPLA